jgi:hypothetical protein
MIGVRNALSPLFHAAHPAARSSSTTSPVKLSLCLFFRCRIRLFLAAEKLCRNESLKMIAFARLVQLQPDLFLLLGENIVARDLAAGHAECWTRRRETVTSCNITLRSTPTELFHSRRIRTQIIQGQHKKQTTASNLSQVLT